MVAFQFQNKQIQKISAQLTDGDHCHKNSINTDEPQPIVSQDWSAQKSWRCDSTWARYNGWHAFSDAYKRCKFLLNFGVCIYNTGYMQFDALNWLTSVKFRIMIFHQNLVVGSVGCLLNKRKKKNLKHVSNIERKIWRND